MSTFEINPHILPRNKSISPDKHHRQIVSGVVAAVLVVCFGAAYYFGGIPNDSSNNPTLDQISKADQQAKGRAQLLAELRSASSSPVTAAQRKELIAALAKSKVTVTAADRQALLDQLRSSK